MLPSNEDTLIKDLNQLTDYRSRLDALNLEKQVAIDAVLTPEIRAELEAIDAEFAEKAEGAQLNIAELEANIKHCVLEYGSTVKGNYLMAVWNKPRTTWDSKKLEGMIAIIPQIAKARKIGEPTVTIRIR